MIQYESPAYPAAMSLWHPVDNPTPEYDRAAVLNILATVASGQPDADALLFMQELAHCLIAADQTAPKALQGRAQAIMQACGLAGQNDPHAAFLEHVERCRGFDGYTQAGAVRSAIDAGLYPTGGDVEQAFKSADKLVNDRRAANKNRRAAHLVRMLDQ